LKQAIDHSVSGSDRKSRRLQNFTGKNYQDAAGRKGQDRISKVGLRVRDARKIGTGYWCLDNWSVDAGTVDWMSDNFLCALASSWQKNRIHETKEIESISFSREGNSSAPSAFLAMIERRKDMDPTS
jgi:hypothetical protein